MLLCPKCGRAFPPDLQECPEDGARLQTDATVAGETKVDPLIGRVLDDKYRLDERLGQGGMGAVYRATHLLIDRPVAVKVLNHRFVTDEAARERFRREARAAGRLRHTNAVAVTDFGQTADDTVYIVMELLEGRSLRELLALEAPLDPARATSIMLQVAAAVAAAHESGIIHRDLKPGNIFIVQRPHAPPIVKVLDFGIAKLMAETADGGEVLNTLTEANAMIGTPRYMSPEQCDGAALSPSSDVYSLGIILYEMLTGITPFTGASPLAVALKHSSEAPRAPREINSSIPPQLEAVVLHALEKNPANRPADAGAFRRELHATAEQLGLEHAAGFTQPTMEMLRDAGTQTPSGRLVIDIERLREARASAVAPATTMQNAKTADTAEEHVQRTLGLPANSPPRESNSPSASRLNIPFNSSSRDWRASLRNPLVLGAVGLAVVLIAIIVALAWRSFYASQASASANDESIGRTLATSGEPRNEKVAPREPRTAAEFYERGAYSFSTRDFDAAARDYEKALELQPEFPEAHNRLGRALLAKGQFREAANEFRKAIEQRHGDYPTAHYNLGFTLQQQRDAFNALNAYNEAIKSAGGNYPDAYYQIGLLQFELRHYAESADALRKAIEQNGGRDPEAYFKLGLSLISQKKMDEAEQAFRTAVEQREGNFAEAHYNLGLLYDERDRPEDAIREYEIYLQQQPNAFNRRLVENSLSRLRRRSAARS
ncbi:MAG: protein kinase [Pyrinomonadaceae bacterium]|nr:protein kinase [Pyrinomonadaceae bacterium]